MCFQGKHDELTTEMSELQQQHFDLQRQLHDVTTEKQRLLDTIAKAQSEASSEEGSLRQTISDLTSAREQEKKEVRSRFPTTLLTLHKRYCGIGNFHLLKRYNRAIATHRHDVVHARCWLSSMAHLCLWEVPMQDPKGRESAGTAAPRRAESRADGSLAMQA